MSVRQNNKILRLIVAYSWVFYLSQHQQLLRPHVITVSNDIRQHTVQTHKERTSTEFNLVTAQSTAHEPPQDGRKYGPKHVGATSLKCF